MKKIMTILLLAIIWQSAAVAQINFLVVSDNGRNGAYLQKPIASLMGQMAENEDFEAVLALGDVHHYMGIESISDPLWMTNFELVYSHPELQIPWYPILGNHEYRGNTQAVIDYSEVSRRWEMEGRYYSKVFEDDGVSVRIVFIDTVPLIDKDEREEHPFSLSEREISVCHKPSMTFSDKAIAAMDYGFDSFSSHSRRLWSGRCFTLKSEKMALKPWPSGQAATGPTCRGQLSCIQRVRIILYSLSSRL